MREPLGALSFLGLPLLRPKESAVPKPIRNDVLLTDRQVAERWATSATTVRRLRYAGVLPTTRVGSLARVSLSAVLAYEAAVTSN